MVEAYDTLGKGIRKLLYVQQDLLDETQDETLKGPIYVRIQQLYNLLDVLIDRALDAKADEYKAAVEGVSQAVEAVQSARKRLEDTLEAMKAVDDFLKLAIRVAKAIA